MKQLVDNLKIVIRYIKIWLLMAKNSLLLWKIKKLGMFIFLLGKVVRFVFYFGFLYFLVKQTNGFANFNGNQILFFTVTYILIDTITQFLFRNVYNFRQIVINGDLDLILVKPINPLFRVLMGAPDPIDFITIPPVIFVVYYIGALLNPSALNIFFYILLVINGLIMSTALHIIILSLGIITTTVDHTVMIYRDLTSMGRLPIDIYKEPFKSILTFVIPVGVMVTISAKSIMGLVSLPGVISTILFGITLLILAIKFWHFALKKYSSASS